MCYADAAPPARNDPWWRILTDIVDEKIGNAYGPAALLTASTSTWLLNAASREWIGKRSIAHGSTDRRHDESMQPAFLSRRGRL